MKHPQTSLGVAPDVGEILFVLSGRYRRVIEFAGLRLPRRFAPRNDVVGLFLDGGCEVFFSVVDGDDAGEAV